MARIGPMHVKRIIGLPTCSVDGCTKGVMRRDSTVESAYCFAHYRVELRRREDALEDALGPGYHFPAAYRQLWDERPRVNLTWED